MSFPTDVRSPVKFVFIDPNFCPGSGAHLFWALFYSQWLQMRPQNCTMCLSVSSFLYVLLIQTTSLKLSINYF